MASYRFAILAAVVLVTNDCAQAQVYKFEDMLVPPSKSLQGVYAYYVYSLTDSPQGKEAPVVKFKGLQAKSTSKDSKNVTGGKGLQLSILPYKDFWKVINPDAFCATAADVSKGLAKEVDSLLVNKDSKVTYSHMIPFATETKPGDVEQSMSDTDVYVLIFSNCGSINDATVSGTVVVQNSYGFLPGNEYHKMGFHGWLAVSWLFFGLIWLGLSFSHGMAGLSSIQHCITCVVVLGLLEATVWWFFFNDWNRSGERWNCLFSVAVLISMMKCVISYSFLLLVALGWVLMQSGLDDIPVKKIILMSTTYLMYGFVRHHVLSFQHAYAFLPTYVFLVELPMPILASCIFGWTYSAFSNIIDTLRERSENDRLQLAERTRMVFSGGVFLAALPTLLRLFLLLQGGCKEGMLSSHAKCVRIEWHTQWFMVDGALHILFLLVIAILMVLWAPSKTADWYSYEDVPNTLAGGKPVESAIWADEDLPEEDEVQNGGKNVVPNTIGAGERRALE